MPAEGTNYTNRTLVAFASTSRQMLATIHSLPNSSITSYYATKNQPNTFGNFGINRKHGDV